MLQTNIDIAEQRLGIPNHSEKTGEKGYHSKTSDAGEQY